MIWECGEAHKVELTVADVGWKIVARVDCLMSQQPCTYFILGIVFSLALMLLPVAYHVYHTKDQLERLDYKALDAIHTAAQLVFGHNWRCEASCLCVCRLFAVANCHSILNSDRFCSFLYVIPRHCSSVCLSVCACILCHHYF